jgi:antirestriction protein ArdC
MTTSSERGSVYERITAEIIAAIEKGTGAWRMPWHHDGSAIFRPQNISSGKVYCGLNTVALWAAAETAGFTHGLWGTYRQWLARGAQVRKGERASLIVFWKVDDPDDQDDGDTSDDESRRKRFMARGYSVFNVAQVDGFVPPEPYVLPEGERIGHADTFLSALKINMQHGADSAYYRPSDDTVHLPAFAHFRDVVSYYGVALHECGHATGAKHRLDRDLTGRFGSETYAAEELCVELASAMVLADLGLANHPRPDHAAYVASWLKVMRDDPRAIFTAASKAQAIADWMHAQQPPPWE